MCPQYHAMRCDLSWPATVQVGVSYQDLGASIISSSALADFAIAPLNRFATTTLGPGKVEPFSAVSICSNVRCRGQVPGCPPTARARPKNGHERQCHDHDRPRVDVYGEYYPISDKPVMTMRVPFTGADR